MIRVHNVVVINPLVLNHLSYELIITKKVHERIN